MDIILTQFLDTPFKSFR